MSSIPLSLSRENGKTITVNKTVTGVAVIVWRQNKGPLLPLELTASEAKGLRTLLDAALATPTPSQGAAPDGEPA